jgi:hypothetical protein
MFSSRGNSVMSQERICKLRESTLTMLTLDR